MRLEDKIKEASYAWIETGKASHRIRMEVLLMVWRTFAPSPALGVMIGGIATAALIWFAGHLLEVMPLVASILIAVEVAGIAWIYQIIYSRYWGGE